MSVYSYFVFALGLVFEFLLIWRIHKQYMRRRYPFFCAYVYFVVGTTLIQFAVLRIYGRFYPIVYWVSDAAAFLLRFCVVWEVLQQTFPRGLGARRVVTLGAASMVICVMSAFFLAGSKEPSTVPFVVSNLGRQTSLIQAVVLAWVLLGALYYGVPLSRNIWGMAVGLGIFASIYTASFAAVHLRHSILPFWQVLSQLSFVLMLGTWTWALWRYAPNPPVPETLGRRDPRLVLWQREWARLLSTLWKAFER